MPGKDELRAIEAKVSALLALELDARLKADPQSRSKPRSLDRLLADAGLEPAEIAPLLGKTPNAVRQALGRKTTGRKTTGRKTMGRKGR
jgi:hypothetical protein